ncbi:hypothetical protein FE257_008884 [Aspergillus nanangensis]|uniref:Aminodeoxychorismate lyase n=1 Tax=Aspergillus nanangensis TaxID=2582783 RepID=A0AAD4CY35_ASPNN|nr:hypothetical protein FE257_008884 [Aspergillus nanangensis]
MSSIPRHIISSLRYDPSLPHSLQSLPPTSYPDPLRSPYYLLPYHQDRLRDAAKCFQWPEAQHFLQQDLTQFAQFLDKFIPDNTQPWRLRILIDRSGTCTVEANPTTAIDLRTLLLPLPPTHDSQSNPWRVYIDSETTTPSALTTHKTTARDCYTAARLRSGIVSPQDPAEVLVVNPSGEIMEGSITTPYFQRRGRRQDTDPAWVTPVLTSGGNSGTTRRYALGQGFCAEDIILASDLADGEECWLSNGVRGFIRGQVVLSARTSTS